LLTDNAGNQATLKTSLGTLTRVLDAVHWPTISKGRPGVVGEKGRLAGTDSFISYCRVNAARKLST
jgi:hypothetical protein